MTIDDVVTALPEGWRFRWAYHNSHVFDTDDPESWDVTVEKHGPQCSECGSMDVESHETSGPTLNAAIAAMLDDIKNNRLGEKK